MSHIVPNLTATQSYADIGTGWRIVNPCPKQSPRCGSLVDADMYVRWWSTGMGPRNHICPCTFEETSSTCVGTFGCTRWSTWLKTFQCRPRITTLTTLRCRRWIRGRRSEFAWSIALRHGRLQRRVGESTHRCGQLLLSRAPVWVRCSLPPICECLALAFLPRTFEDCPRMGDRNLRAMGHVELLRRIRDVDLVQRRHNHLQDQWAQQMRGGISKKWRSWNKHHTSRSPARATLKHRTQNIRLVNIALDVQSENNPWNCSSVAGCYFVVLQQPCPEPTKEDLFWGRNMVFDFLGSHPKHKVGHEIAQ